MKRIIISISTIICFVFCCAQTPSESELMEWSNLFAIDEILFVSDTTSGLYHMPHQQILEYNLFSHKNSIHILPNDINGNNILIIADSSIYYEISSYIIRYAEDIHYHYNMGVDIEVSKGGNYEDIKNLILSYNSNLEGCILIGDIDVAYFEINNDFGKYGYKSWPCDLYYMDLDGQWLDIDDNGIYDTHTGDVKPEIYVGRISAKNMGNLVSEVSGLISFFDKDHRYWSGNIEVQNHALAYNNRDWVKIPYFTTGIEYVFGSNSVDTCNCDRCSLFSADDYLEKITSNTYGFIQLSAHSSSFSHTFDCNNNEYITSNTIFNSENHSIGYNLFCCSACNWKAANENGYIGGSYLFNSPSCLFVIGSTKSGSLLGFNNFYSNLGDNYNAGVSLKKWWINTYSNNHSNYVISWHYGLSILGDPMIILNNNIIESCQDTLILNNYDTSLESNIQIYKASKCIIIGGNFHIPFGKTIIVDAPSVNIAPEFYCPIGASFEIRNNGCNN